MLNHNTPLWSDDEYHSLKYTNQHANHFNPDVALYTSRLHLPESDSTSIAHPSASNFD